MTSRKAGLEKGAQEISPRIAAKGGGMTLYLRKRRGKGSSTAGRAYWPQVSASGPSHHFFQNLYKIQSKL